MKLRHVVSIAAAVTTLALVATGCGTEDSCPTESPDVAAVPNCTVRPGAAVSYPVQLCPTCNQTGAVCDVDLSAASSGDIFLDPRVEACTPSSTCPGTAPACDASPLLCPFTAPTVEGDYVVTLVDASSPTAPITRTLRVSSVEPVSCALTL
jgi:hypothetical protein